MEPVEAPEIPIFFDPPVVSREPIQDRERNPKGVRRPFKTDQDHMPVDQRPRKQMSDRQREWMRENKPTCSTHYARMPR